MGKFPDGSPFPDHYAEVAPSVVDSGYRLVALEPTAESVDHVFILRAYRFGKLAAEKRPALSHDNRFGLDVEDLQALEDATTEMLRELQAGESAAAT